MVEALEGELAHAQGEIHPLLLVGAELAQDLAVDIDDVMERLLLAVVLQQLEGPALDHALGDPLTAFRLLLAAGVDPPFRLLDRGVGAAAGIGPVRGKVPGRGGVLPAPFPRGAGSLRGKGFGVRSVGVRHGVLGESCAASRDAGC